MSYADYAIVAENISKTFPGVKALDKVTLKVRKGEVHGLIGENGAGKSTLIKVLMGVHQKDKGSGDIYIHGRKVEIDGPIKAEQEGLAAVYQHMMLAPHLSVGENIFLGQQQKKGILVDWATLHAQARQALGRVGLEKIDPRQTLRNLTPVQQEMVAIAKALEREAKVMVFDEPTALLAEEETKELFSIIHALKDRGISIIYISHRLDEIFQVCDRVSVLRDGQYVGTESTDEITEGDMIRMMVGRQIEDLYYKEDIEYGDEILRVSNLKRKDQPHLASFSLRQGEILGIFGLVGSGRTELVRALFGADPIEEGTIEVGGTQIEVKGPSDAVEQGIGFIPEDRQNQGVALPLSLVANANLISGRKTSRWGLLNFGKEKRTAETNVNELKIRTPHIHQKVQFLSGGNQQKVVIAKWLNVDSKVLIFDEPTVGIDVGAKTEIYKLMARLLREGKGIVFISSYLPELLGICDRILVIAEGDITGILDRDEATQERLLELASNL